MKIIALITCLLAAYFNPKLSAQDTGIRFFEGTWEQALEQAEKTGKLIFLDAYAVWCGPCKVMARDVFTQEAAGELYNKHFINFKMDMEKGIGPSLAQKYQVTAYPTLLFVNAKGDVVHQGRGSLPLGQFLDLGKAALTLNDQTESLTKLYKEGNREPDFLRRYALALLQGAKPHLKITNEFLRTNPDFTKADNLDFLLEALVDADSRVFDYVVLHQKALFARSGDSSVQASTRLACEATAKKAANYQQADLLKQAKTQYKKIFPKDAAVFALRLDALYAFELQAWDDWAKATDKWLKKAATGTNPKPWLEQAALAYRYCEGKPLPTQKAETWAEQAIKREKTKKAMFLYAELLQRNGKTELAKTIHRQAESL